MIEVRPEGYIDEPGSDIRINMRDIRNRFRYNNALSEIAGDDVGSKIEISINSIRHKR
jgi:hypothetical protein